ncbi:MAG TPA: GNAT family N-acetyltransferase [Vulgatibacter sp.]
MRSRVTDAEPRLRFRPIDVEQDLGLAAGHRRDSFFVSFGHEKSFDEDKYVLHLAQLLERIPGSAVFALLDGEVVGQIEAHVRPGGIGYVNLFYLVPKYRGRNLGRQLHEYALDLLRAQRVQWIDLAVSPTNTPALRFYEKLGYRRLGLRPNAEPPVFEMRFDLASP